MCLLIQTATSLGKLESLKVFDWLVSLVTFRFLAERIYLTGYCLIDSLRRPSVKCFSQISVVLQTQIMAACLCLTDPCRCTNPRLYSHFLIVQLRYLQIKLNHKLPLRILPCLNHNFLGSTFLLRCGCFIKSHHCPSISTGSV